MRILVCLLFPLSLWASTVSDILDVEVYKTKRQKPQVTSFCERHPMECDRSGEQVLKLTPELLKTIQSVNLEVNQSISFVLDPDQYDQEEFWNIPSSGMGDCEDNALEKRRRLALLGLSRGSMSMATAFHKTQLYAHGLLIIETDKGSLVLDQDNDEVLLWHETVYGFESRERVDGSWEYFVQDWLL